MRKTENRVPLLKKAPTSRAHFSGDFLPWGVLLLLIPLFVFFGSWAYADQVDFGEFIHLDEGMSEGEILARIGFPDKEVYLDDLFFRHGPVRKQLFYIPEPESPDPHVTVITLQGGRVLELERTKLFSPPERKHGGQMDFGVYRRLELGMTEGEILARAGRPDREVWIGNGLGALRAFYYIPDREEADPHLTVVTIQNGKVVNLERKKIFSR